MIALHEALLLVVAQPGSFAAKGFAEQEARHAGQAEGGGMELIELHVSDGGAGAPCHGYAVAGSHGGIGGVAVNLARAAAGQQDGACADGLTFALLRNHAEADDAIAIEDEVLAGDPLGKRDVGDVRARVQAGSGRSRRRWRRRWRAGCGSGCGLLRE